LVQLWWLASEKISLSLSSGTRHWWLQSKLKELTSQTTLKITKNMAPMKSTETCTIYHHLEYDPSVAKQWMIPTDVMNDIL